MLCRLCISDCGHSFVELIDSSGQITSAHKVVAKYFEKEINNLAEIKTENDLEHSIEYPNMNKQVICDTCWCHINDFSQWQDEVISLQEQRIKKLRQPYQRQFVENVKLEVEMDFNSSEMFANTFVDAVYDNHEFFNETIEDPVAISEKKVETTPDLSANEDEKYEENDINDSSYEDMPLTDRKKLAKTKAPSVRTKKATRGRKKKTKKRLKSEEPDSNVESNLDEDKDDLNNSDKNMEKSLKTKRFDAFIRQHFKATLPCALCDHESADFTELRIHYRNVHNNDKGYVLCCKHKYTQRFHFVEHLEVHLNPQKFQCTVCGKCSANGRSLVAHMKSMHGPTPLERLFECEICHKKFAKKPILKSHMETHLEGNPEHICKECGKGFILESRLNIHIRNVHSTSYLSVCDQCGKSFRGRYALKYHMLEHDGAGKQRYPCDQCDAELHSKFSLKRHKRIAHHDGSKVYICSECGKVALTEDALKSHKRYVHRRERTHKCTICEKAFKAAKVLKEHMTTHTGEDLYQCPHCPRTFKVNANMHHHRKRKHPKEWEENRRKRQMSFRRVDLNAMPNEISPQEQVQVVL
ncbi:transcription factor grauzone-like [Eurosta solidaginis]|uniref:transcription factor grauzone-like n=1 Tax=Eurosta solidaginis TaxID=178769 RepID=UPI0035310F2A